MNPRHWGPCGARAAAMIDVSCSSKNPVVISMCTVENEASTCVLRDSRLSVHSRSDLWTPGVVQKRLRKQHDGFSHTVHWCRAVLYRQHSFSRQQVGRSIVTEAAAGSRILRRRRQSYSSESMAVIFSRSIDWLKAMSIVIIWASCLLLKKWPIVFH